MNAVATRITNESMCKAIVGATACDSQEQATGATVEKHKAKEVRIALDSNVVT